MLESTFRELSYDMQTVEFGALVAPQYCVTHICNLYFYNPGHNYCQTDCSLFRVCPVTQSANCCCYVSYRNTRVSHRYDCRFGGKKATQQCGVELFKVNACANAKTVVQAQNCLVKRSVLKNSATLLAHVLAR